MWYTDCAKQNLIFYTLAEYVCFYSGKNTNALFFACTFASCV